MTELGILGRKSEDVAAKWLVEKGFSVVERNFREKSCEIDIIAKRHDSLFFVEVRSRKGLGNEDAAFESVTPRKQLKLRHCAEIYAFKNHCANMDLAIIVMAITWYNPSRFKVNVVRVE